MRVLVTGSSGLIGVNLSLRLIEAGHDVLGVDLRENPWTDRFETRRLDLREPLPEVGRFDVVVHLAAHAKVFELVRHPERAMENVATVFHALDFARRTQTPFIFGSSREVYGDIHRRIASEAMADFVVAESPYSASKIAGEAFTYSYCRCYDLPYLVFRFSNVYGRYDSDQDRLERVIPLFAGRIGRGEPIVVYGREKVLDFTYVDDCVSGLASGVEALAEGRVLNQTINLASGKGFSLGDLVTFLSRAIGREPKVSFEPRREGEISRYVADIRRARELLGYSPKDTLESGVPKAVAWYRSVGFLAPA